jgi:hypothetical protein
MAMIPGGGVTILISSAYRKRGLMFQKWKELFGNDDADDICWVADSRTMNPLLPAEVVDKAMAEDPARARAEYLSEWRDDLSDFVPADVIDAATEWGVIERPPQPNILYKAFADPAGGTGGDAFTLAIGHAEPDGAIVMDALRSRAPRFSPADVVHEYSDLVKAYRVWSVTGDRYAGAWCSDEFQRNGISYMPSARTKSEIYLASLPLLLNGRARLLDNETLRKQLGGLVRRVHPGGRESVDHGPYAGAHDDTANSACGALTEIALGAAGGDAWVAHYKALAEQSHVADQERRDNSRPWAATLDRPAKPAPVGSALEAAEQAGLEMCREYERVQLGFSREPGDSAACWCGRAFAAGEPVATDGHSRWHPSCGPAPVKKVA